MINRTNPLPFRQIYPAGLLLTVSLFTLLIQTIKPGAAIAAPSVVTLPTLWEAGGISAGSDGAGQAARIAADPAGNVAVVSGPAQGSLLAVTSYTPDGVFRWQKTIAPSIGVFLGDWLAAAPNGDFVAVGRNFSQSSGNPIAISMVRYGSDGTFQWRVDIAGTFPAVGRLLVDSGGNAYLAFNTLGDGQDIRLRKYSPAGALLWSQTINTGFMSNNIATSLALSSDESEVVLTGNTSGGAEWITALYDTSTGFRKWLMVAPEGTAARDAVIDAGRVYVTGQGVTDPGTPDLAYHLTVIAYDRTTGAKLWRTDEDPVDGTHSAGLRIALAPDGSLVATGQTSRGFLDWFTVSLETNGSVRWEAVRDGGLNTNEIPSGLLTLPDGTTVVTGPGGPNLPGGFIPGVTAGYSPDGVLLWDAFSRLATVWVTALPGNVVCATGGYDALVTCWSVPPVAPPTPTPTATASPTPGGRPTKTPTPTLMPTATPAPGGTIHIGDLDGSSAPGAADRWNATVVITVHDAADNPVSGVTVSGAWSAGASGSASCITNASGQCSVIKTGIRNSVLSVTFTVTNASHASLTYQPGANHDPDGDSSGTLILVNKP